MFPFDYTKIFYAFAGDLSPGKLSNACYFPNVIWSNITSNFSDTEVMGLKFKKVVA